MAETLPETVCYSVGVNSQSIVVDVGAPTWAYDLYTSVEIMSQQFPNFQIEFRDEYGYLNA